MTQIAFLHDFGLNAAHVWDLSKRAIPHTNRAFKSQPTCSCPPWVCDKPLSGPLVFCFPHWTRIRSENIWHYFQGFSHIFLIFQSSFLCDLRLMIDVWLFPTYTSHPCLAATWFTWKGHTLQYKGTQIHPFDHGGWFRHLMVMRSGLDLT